MVLDARAATSTHRVIFFAMVGANMEDAMKRALCVVVVAAGCAGAAPSVRGIALPEAPVGGVLMDYLAYDRAHHRVWVPAGNTGKVDGGGAPGGAGAHDDGFATKEVERHSKNRIAGPR